MLFKLNADYVPTGDQPEAIERLDASLKAGNRYQTLLGVTGSGKTFTMANLIARQNRPTLVISHNKTLAAQLYSEFKNFFPENAVEYFVSYYDYYQPEAYIPARDIYIEKDSSKNDDLDRLRLAATSAVVSRRDTIVVALVTTVLTVFASAATGYALAKYDNRWLKVFFVCILATTMLPTEVILAPTFIVIRDLGMYDSLAGIIVPSIITATGIFMFRQFFLTVPDDLVEAARIDGASEFGIFFRIMLPISRPIMLTLAIFSFQWRWNDYIWPLLVLNDPHQFTIQIALQSIVGAENVNWTVLLGASVISILPLLLIYLVFQKYVNGADLNAGLKD